MTGLGSLRSRAFVELREESQQHRSASCCASTASTATASTTSRSACGSQSSAGWRRPRAPSSKSKRCSIHRCSRWRWAHTISPRSLFPTDRPSGFVRRGQSGGDYPADHRGRCPGRTPWCSEWRDAIDADVRAVLAGYLGAIAAMPLNRRRDVISETLDNALFISWRRPRAVDLRLTCGQCDQRHSGSVTSIDLQAKPADST